MKRSEMLLLIAKTIYESSLRSSYLETMPVAINVLKAIEDAGILPPIEPDRTVSDLDLGIPEWEDEDDDNK